MNFNELPYMANESLPQCEYGKAAALRVPIRDAINTARSMPPAKMEQVIHVLETALAHIRTAEKKNVKKPKGTKVPASSDPLDELLGTT